MDTRVVVVALAMVIHPMKGRAADPLYEQVAAYVGVPAPLLYAMSQAESGMVREGAFAPWPFCIRR